MNFTCLVLGVVFIVTGIYFAKGKLLIYIDAWNKMSKEEKDNILITPLCRNIGLMISSSGLIFLASGILENFRENFFIYAIVSWFIIAFIDLYLIEKRNKYQIKK